MIDVEPIVKKDVSIIIVNYNTCQLTLECLRSIYNNTKKVDFEVIVVDNASTDSSVVVIKKVFPQVKVIENSENLGFGRANNLGVKYAKGDFLFLLNSDTILINNAVYEFWTYWKHCKDSNIGCLGSFLLSQDEVITHSYGYFPTFVRILIHKLFRKNKTENILISDRKEVDYVTGADLFISYDNFLKAGMFSPLFFMYYEETWLQTQLKRMNMRRIIISSPKIIHLEGCSYKEKLANRKRIQIDISLLTYWKLYYGKLLGTVFSILYLLMKLPIFFKSDFNFKENLMYFNTLFKSL